MTTFSLGAILTYYTGRMLTSFDEVYAFGKHMTGESVMTHQVPRVMDECHATLLAQFPFLAEIAVPKDLRGEAPVLAWVASQVALYGDEFEVHPLAAGDHTYISPLAEFSMMAPHAQVIAL